MSTPHQDLGWMLESLREGTPGIRHVLVLSADGLKASHTAGLTDDAPDQLAAIASGFQSIGVAAAAQFGTGTGWVRSVVEYPGGVMLITPAGTGSQLAVIAAEEADIDLIGLRMAELVEQIGSHLATPPRDLSASETAVPPS